MGVANSWGHKAAALHTNLQATQNLGGVANGIVGAIEAVDSERMVLGVETLRSQEQMQISECAMDFESLVVDCNGRYPCNGVCELAQRSARRDIRTRLCGAWLCFMLR